MASYARPIMLCSISGETINTGLGTRPGTQGGSKDLGPKEDQRTWDPRRIEGPGTRGPEDLGPKDLGPEDPRTGTQGQRDTLNSPVLNN